MNPPSNIERSNPVPPLLPMAMKALQVNPTDVLLRWANSLNPLTRRKYGQGFRRFVMFATGAKMNDNDAAQTSMRIICDAGGKAPARELLLAWRQSMEEEGLASATVAGCLSSMCSAIQAFSDAGLLEFEIRRIAPKAEAREDRSGPPRHEVERPILTTAEEEAAGCTRALRDLCMLRLLHDAALRRFEVTGLRRCDVQLDHPDGPRVMPLRKGHKEREAMLIGKGAANALREWLDKRVDQSPNAAVFVSLQHGRQGVAPLSFESLRKALHARAKRLGIKATVRPHGLRHSAASHCARNASLAALKRLGGWVTLSSPARYLDQDDLDRIAALNVVEIRA